MEPANDERIKSETKKREKENKEAGDNVMEC